MPRLQGIRRVLRLPRSGVDSAAIDDELRFHVECRVDDLTADGMAESDARALPVLQS